VTVERELILTGVGGQGVQLAAQVLARGAIHDGRQAMLFGIYSGMMRGGNSDSSLVVGDGPIQAPPLVSRAWSALAMHHEFWEPLAPKLRAGGVVVVNSSLFEGVLDRDAYRVFDVPAGDIAAELGNPLVAAMVMAGAYAAITDLVSLDGLLDGMRESVPPYRRQHIAANESAIRAGFDRAPRLAAPAWETAEAVR
jgi:Pyruvate/2-oxoacid:ferredoxin oxidoreductase gamma subunit